MDLRSAAERFFGLHFGSAQPRPSPPENLRSQAPQLASRPMEARITVNPAVCNGRPIVRGTRVTVQTILEFLAAGDSVEDVLEGYPELVREDIMACLRFSSQILSGSLSVEKVA